MAIMKNLIKIKPCDRRLQMQLMKQQSGFKQAPAAVISDMHFIVARYLGMTTQKMRQQAGLRSHVTQQKKMPSRFY
ncbi:hypothetical protein CKO33_08210 [Ectothiorhodospira mobilis]|nr:hypothetical protein [Ectothiorhodospira mobilis]